MNAPTFSSKTILEGTHHNRTEHVPAFAQQAICGFLNRAIIENRNYDKGVAQHCHRPPSTLSLSGFTWHVFRFLGKLCVF